MAVQPEVSSAMARAVTTRMDELGLTMTELGRLTGVSPPPLRRIARGEVHGYDKATKLAVARVLGWAPDSIDRLMAGKRHRMAFGGENGLGAQALADILRRLDALEREAEEVRQARRDLIPQIVDNTEAVRRVWDRLDEIARAVRPLVDPNSDPLEVPPGLAP